MYVIIDISSKITYEKKEIRGNIYDRNGTVLASSINSKSLSARPHLINNIDLLSAKLEEILNIDEGIIKKQLSNHKKYDW